MGKKNKQKESEHGVLPKIKLSLKLTLPQKRPSAEPTPSSPPHKVRKTSSSSDTSKQPSKPAPQPRIKLRLGPIPSSNNPPAQLQQNASAQSVFSHSTYTAIPKVEEDINIEDVTDEEDITSKVTSVTADGSNGSPSPGFTSRAGSIDSDERYVKQESTDSFDVNSHYADSVKSEDTTKGNGILNQPLKGPRRVRGKFAKRIKLPHEKGPAPVRKYKKNLYVVLSKCLELLNRKDQYGFFLHPVDTNIVTDYLTVIKHPMDFSTMQQKVDRKIYRSVAEFKDDLTLLCQNAKTYNAPATPYYKLAEKLLDWGTRWLDKEEPFTTLEDDSSSKMKGEEDIDIVSMKSADTSQDQIDRSRSSTPVKLKKNKKKQTKLKEASKAIYLGDASFDSGYQDPLDFIPQPDAWLEIPLLGQPTVDDEEGTPASFLDYGPFAYPDPKINTTPVEASFQFHVYGNATGEAYINSLKSFVEDMDPYVKNYVNRISSAVTLGGADIAAKVEELETAGSKKDTNIEPMTQHKHIVRTEVGTVDVAAELDYLKRFAKAQELEFFRRQKVDLGMFYQDEKGQVNLSSFPTGDVSAMTVPNPQRMAELLELSKSELLKVYESRSGNTDINSEDVVESLQSLKNRLFSLARQLPPWEIIQPVYQSSSKQSVSSSKPSQGAHPQKSLPRSSSTPSISKNGTSSSSSHSSQYSKTSKNIPIARPGSHSVKGKK